jgi:hypothetical protein
MAYTTIDKPTDYFNTVLYTGSDGTQSVTGVGFQPDWSWLKCRSTAYYHRLFDTVRGAGKNLRSDTTNAEQTVDEGITAFNSDGFSVKQGFSLEYNASGETYVSWNWKESATAGFDIVSYTGNGTDDTDISHNLSAVPKMIVVKNRDAADAWQVYHAGNTAAPETDYEAPTSSVFTLGDGAEVNTNTENYIAYCFAEKQGFSKFGSYTGNGNADGTFVYTGFRPALVITKSIDSTSSWHMFDNKREGYNVDNDPLVTEDTTAEATTDMIDLLSNGFKCRITTDPNVAETYVYLAFAEAPFVNSNGVPCNAR